MPRYRIHRSPGDDDKPERTVSFDVLSARKPRRKGLFGRLKSESSDPAPWETNSDTRSTKSSTLDRNVPTASRLRNVGKARRAVTGSDFQAVRRGSTSTRLKAISDAHTVDDTDDPWAKSTGGAGYDAEAKLPPIPAPVPPDPQNFWAADDSSQDSDDEFQFAVGTDDPAARSFNSDSFWGLPSDEKLSTPDTSADATQDDPAGGQGFDLSAPPSPGRDEGFLGAGDFDMDVGFTHDSLAPAGEDDAWGSSFGPLGLAGEDASETATADDLFAVPSRAAAEAPAAPAPRPAPRREPATPAGDPAPWGDDLSYPDIPSLTVEDALTRGRELLSANKPEDALTVLEMGLRMAPGHSALTTWVDFAERKVLADILPDARSDRFLRLAGPAPQFADPRDARLIASLTTPRTFSDLRARHSGMSMREFAGRIHAMLSMRAIAWD